MTAKSNSTWLDEQKVRLTRELERVRDDVTTSLETELKRRDEEHQAELKKRDEKERILSARYEDEIIKNAHLIEENGSLKHRLEKRDQRKSTPKPDAAETGKTSAPEATPSDDEATVSMAEYRHIVERFDELNKKYQEIIRQAKYLEKKNVAVMEKNKSMKEGVKAWQKYADRHLSKNLDSQHSPAKTSLEIPKATIEQRPPTLSTSPGPAPTSTPGSLTGLNTSSPAPFPFDKYRILNDRPSSDPRERPQSMAGQSSDHEPKQYRFLLPRIQHERPEDRNHRHRDVEMSNAVDYSRFPDEEQGPNAVDVSRFPDEHNEVNDRITSSQTTVDQTQTPGEMLPPSKRAADDDDFEPVVVSERNLKRKRIAPRAAQDGRLPSDGTPAKPFRIKEEPRSSPPPQTTPSLLRNETMDLDELGPNVISTPRGRRRQNAYVTKVGTLRHQCSSSVPLVKEEVTKRGEQGASIVRGDPGAGNAREHSGASAFAVFMASETRANSEPSEQSRRPHPLMERDANARMLVHTDDQTPSKRLRRDEAEHLEKYQMLTESGEEPPPMDENRKKLTPKNARAKFNERFKKNSKDNQTPTKSTPRAPTTAPSKLYGAQFMTPTSVSRRPFAPSLGGGSRNGAQSEPRPSMLKPTPKPQAQAGPQAPIRNKPVSELKISDFKANPKYNQGFSYAFAETVRKRADRACLTGCTRPECCGSHFRALAIGLPSLTPRQEKSLLEDFLGDAYEEMQLTQMKPEERKDLILQARTKLTATQYGKHRNAYERPKSPPGYWRVEFPSTQEQEEDKRKADELERQTILERRAEALRKGGRWMFRDE